MASSFNFTFPRTERSLSEALAGTPRAFREEAKKGFKVLAAVGQQHYAEILRAVMLTLESRQPPFEDLEKRLPLSRDDIGALMASAMITVSLLGNGGTAEEFTSAATKVDMLPADLVSEIRPFIEVVVADRSQIRRALRRAAMPSQVLPFLAVLEIVVDLRMAFEEQKVSESVPVAIIHIDTDAQNQEIWFQASKSQMERLRSDVDAGNQAYGAGGGLDPWGICIMIVSAFEPPHFTFWNTIYTAIGAAVFWGRSGRTKLKVYYLSHVFDLMRFPEGPWRRFTEFAVFIVLGCLIGIGIARPASVPQAITAGFAWTGFIAKRG